jgi:DNA polymerase-1
MYLTPTDKHWVIDIETDDVQATVIWVMCARNVKTKQEITLRDYDDIRNWIAERLAEGAIFVGHNIMAFDAPVLNRIVHSRIASTRLVDTFILSMLYSPSLRGGHSLEAWGERLGERKIQFNDFSRLTEEMVEYCVQDVRVNCRLFERLTLRMKQVGFSEKSARLEHLAWRNIQKQKKNGFAFDQPRAHALFAELRGVEAELKELIYHKFPPQLLPVKEYKSAYKKDGSHTKGYGDHLQQYERLDINADGSYTAFDFVEFDLGSPAQRATKLTELGWEPLDDERTPTGLPRPTYKGELVPSLAQFAEEAGIEEVQLIAQWIAVNSRANTISNWLDLYNPDTGAIHGNLWLANTLRYRHDKPNTANIPAVRLDKEEKPLRGRAGLWTYEARDLWVSRDPVNRCLVGVDAKGIQLRVLANALNNPEYTAQVLKGDPHKYTMSITLTGTRPQNKNFIYAYLLGGGNAKLGSLLGVDKRQGGIIKKRFTNNFPGLKELLERLESEVNKTGRLQLCDGAMSLVTEARLALAYLLQGDESRIMRQAGVFADEGIRKKGLDVLKVGDIHDEWQNDVLRTDKEEYLKVCEQAFANAGEEMNYKLPIECDAKIGLTWAETH